MESKNTKDAMKEKNIDITYATAVFGDFKRILKHRSIHVIVKKKDYESDTGKLDVNKQ